MRRLGYLGVSSGYGQLSQDAGACEFNTGSPAEPVFAVILVAWLTKYTGGAIISDASES